MKKEFFPIAFKQFFHLNQFSHSIKQFFTLCNHSVESFFHSAELSLQHQQTIITRLRIVLQSSFVRKFNHLGPMAFCFVHPHQNFLSLSTQLLLRIVWWKIYCGKSVPFSKCGKKQNVHVSTGWEKPMFSFPSGVKSNVRFPKCV